MSFPLIVPLLASVSGAAPAWTTVESPWPEGTRPCAIAAGEGGVLWMVDCGDELGSVWRLVDADGDRRYETASRFAENLVEPRAVLADGAASVLVLEKSSLLRLTDIDRDGRHDEARIVAKAEGATGVVRGSDGWIRLVGTGTSIDVGNRAVRSRRSWPMTGSAVERPDGSWLSADGSTVVVVTADDHAIVRNPRIQPPWGSVVAERLEGQVLAIAADGDGALLVESEGPVTELRRRSLAVDGIRLSPGIPEAIATFTRDRPFAIASVGDGSFAIATAESLRVISDGRPSLDRTERAIESAEAFDPLRLRDPDRVAAAVLAGGGQPDDLALPRFEQAFAAAGADKRVRDSILAGLAGREVEFLERLLGGFPSESPALDAMCRSVADSALAAADEVATRRLVELAARLGDRPRSREAILGRVLAATEPNARLRNTLFVDLEPIGWRELVTSGASSASMAIDPHLRWPGRSDLPPLPDPNAGLDLVELGRRTYATCVTCHGSGGLGQPRVYPPLKGSDWVTGDPRRLVRILLHGLQGPIAVNGEPYSSVMLLPRPLTDREIAAVLTYIRQAWGNDAVAVEEALVREIRSTTASRNEPWTSAELDAIMRGTSP